MSYTNLSARVDVNDKKRFESFCENTGMNVSVAVNLFIKAVLRENRLPFEIGLKSPNLLNFDEITKEELDEAIAAGLRDVEAGRVCTVEELDEELNRKYGI